MLEYDHEENDNLELLADTDSDDIFTFNANEIYITEPSSRDLHDRGFEEDFGFEEDNSSYDYEGFGADDLFFPQKATNRFSIYEEVCYRNIFMF